MREACAAARIGAAQRESMRYAGYARIAILHRAPHRPRRRGSAMGDDRRSRASTRPGRRRFVLGAAAAAGAWGAGPRDALAQSREAPVRLVLGFVAGGAADRIARVLAPELSKGGHPAIVENLPGANGARAIARVVLAEPPGDALLFATSAIAHPDNAEAVRSLRPVIVVSTSPMVLVVRASLPVRDPAEFARYAREHPGMTYGSAGIGNATHLCAEELMERIGAPAVHVPYQGSSASLNDLYGDRIDFLTAGASLALANHPNARVIAVTTLRRSTVPGTERLPTIAETIAPGFDFGLWQAVWASSRLSDAAVDVLNARFRAALEAPAVRRALTDVGAEIVSGTPEDALALFRAEVERYRKRPSR